MRLATTTGLRRCLCLPCVVVALAGCSETPKGATTNPSGNVAPTLSSVTLAPEPAYEQTLLNCTPAGTADGDGDNVSLFFAWTVNGVASAATTQTLNGTDFSKGDLVSCTVTPNDGVQDGTPVASNVVTIQNTPPSGTGVDVTPDPATAIDTLLATPLGFSDVDGDDEFWRYDWFVNGVAAGVTNDSLAGEFVKGDEVYVVVTPDDGDDQGDPIQSDTLVIQNTPPVAAGVQLTPASPNAASLLMCLLTGASDADNDPVTPLYQWYVNGTAAGSGTELLAAPAFSRGDNVYCVITPNDGEDDGAPVTSNSAIILNTPPAVASVTLTPDPAREGDTFTCAPSGIVDADGDLVTLQFVWTVAGLPVPVATSTLSSAWFDKGDPVTCTVTPNDGITAGTSVVSNVVIVENTPPVLASATISPVDPTTNSTVTALPSGFTDADGDPGQYTYAWYVNGGLVAGATTAQLQGTLYFQKHDFLEVEITPFDGDDYGPPAMSAPLEVLNAPPGAPIVQITPNLPDNDDTLVCSITLGSTDADGDLVTYSYNWKRNGVNAGITVNNVGPASTAYGDAWICEVTPDDGEDLGPFGSAIASIVDTSPPGAPVLDQLDTPRNDTAVLVTGNGEPLTVIDVYATCDGPSSGTQQTGSDPLGDFAVTWNMTRGETCSFQATSTDAQFNVSPLSNTVLTTVCGTEDPWEDGSYGNDAFNPIDEWLPLPDTGAGTVNISGTILPGDPEDWYVIHTTDNLATDLFNGWNAYNFGIDLTVGDGTYNFIVYKGDVGLGNVECAGMATGYDRYNDAYWGQAWGGTGCGTASWGVDDCTDFTNSYYIRVVRNPAVAPSCTSYNLAVTNGLPFTP